MKKLIAFAFVSLLLVAGAFAQGVATEVVENSSGTRVLRTRDHTWLWGFGSSTPSTFLSENIPIGAAFFNTSTGVISYYSGSAWVSGSNATLSGDNTWTGTNEFSGQTNISGPDATSNVEIGSTANDANAGTGGTSVVVGNAAANASNGAGNVIIGSSATVPTAGATGSVVIGLSAEGRSANTVAIGASAINTGTGVAQVLIGKQPSSNCSGNNNILIGNSAACTGTSANSVAIGPVATIASRSNAFVSGSDGFPISDVYFADGPTSTTQTAWTLHGGGGSGSDNAGGRVNIAGGFGTGTAAGGDVVLQRSPSIATGSTAQTAADGLYLRSQKKALTAATATAFARINLAAGVAAVTGWTGGTIFYTLVANDAADFQSRSGSINFTLVNKAGTETCAVGTVTNEPVADSSGTTTLTFDTDTAGPTNGCDIRATGASSLTETTLALFWTAIMNGPGTITPQ